MPVTDGQLEFEKKHLSRKLRRRDAAKLRAMRAAMLRPHPMLRVVNGGIEDWEIV